MKHPGLFVVLEGPDGTGKTTQCERLGQLLEAGGQEVVWTRQPSDGRIGRQIRKVLGDPGHGLDHLSLVLMFMADRADHLQREIMPALERGAVVICDRYLHSTICYQGAQLYPVSRVWGMARVLDLHRTAQLLMPDVTYVLQVEHEVAHARIAARRSADEIFDDIETQIAVDVAYRQLRNLDRSVVYINGGVPPEQVTQAILADLNARHPHVSAAPSPRLSVV